MDTICLVLYKRISNKCFKDLKHCNLKWKKTKNKKGEYVYSIFYSNCYIEYNFVHNSLRISVSVTKLLYGENFHKFNLNDLTKLYETLDFIVRILIKKRLQSVRCWILTRLDLVSNFTSSSDKNTYIGLLKKLIYSRCEINEYETSVHAHNNSICYNLYDKNTQCKYYTIQTLRIEIQFKNRSLYNLVKNDTFKGKTFVEVMSNIKVLESIYRDRLKKIGLDKIFLTKQQMGKFLKQLYQNKKIGKTKFNNMYNYFINESETIKKTTINNYKDILAKYNYSHIVLDQKITHKIDFMKFSLFKPEKKCTLSVTKLMLQLIIIYLLINNEGEINMTTISKTLFRPFIQILKNININDDS